MLILRCYKPKKKVLGKKYLINNYPFKNNNIIFGSFLEKRKDSISWKILKHPKLIYLTNIIFDKNFFLIISYEIFWNDIILISQIMDGE